MSDNMPDAIYVYGVPSTFGFWTAEKTGSHNVKYVRAASGDESEPSTQQTGNPWMDELDARADELHDAMFDAKPPQRPTAEELAAAIMHYVEEENDDTWEDRYQGLLDVVGAWRAADKHDWDSLHRGHAAEGESDAD